MLSNKDFPPRGLELEVGSELLVIGYPRGFTDQINQLPIAKNCIVSTPIQIPFDGKPYFLMDGNLFPGMSGIVDSKYIEKSGDGNYKVGQRIIVKENDVLQLIEIIEKIVKQIRLKT